MKNFKSFAFTALLFLSCSLSVTTHAQSDSDVQTSLQAQTPDSGISLDTPHLTVVNYDAPTVSEVIVASKAETFVDSLQAVANVVADKEFKALLLQTIEQLQNKPDTNNPATIFSWLSALFTALGALITFLFLRFGVYLKGLNLNMVMLMLLSSIFLHSCASCQFTSNYNYVDDKVLGCVECKNVKQTLKQGASQLHLRLLKIK